MKLIDLIAPVSEKEFRTKILGRKPFVFQTTKYKTKFFSDIISWKQLSDYINNHRASAGLQVITAKGDKRCMERGNLHIGDKPHWEKKDRYQVSEVFKVWQEGGSIILTKASMLTPNISAIAGCLEEAVANSACDAHFYCSQKVGARSFDLHCDEDDNFLVHAIGEVHWQVFRKGSKTDCVIDKTLGPGNLLYIPKGTWHRATPVTPRISISVPLAIHPEIIPLTRSYYDFKKIVLDKNVKKEYNNSLI